MASVQFQDITRQQVEHVIECVKHIDSHAQEIAGLIERGDDHASEIRVLKPLSDQLDAMYSRYVMDEQRDVHQRTLNQGSAKATPANAPRKSNIELF